jgi:cytochrome c biogenesis protein
VQKLQGGVLSEQPEAQEVCKSSSIVENGRISVEKVIEVNDPLKYKGLTFYQAGDAPAGEPIFTVELEDLSTGRRATHTVGFHEKVPISGDNSYFSIIDFSPNYVPEISGMEHRDLGPTALIAIYEGKR